VISKTFSKKYSITKIIINSYDRVKGFVGVSFVKVLNLGISLNTFNISE
jgi:hypothetical protein